MKKEDDVVIITVVMSVTLEDCGPDILTTATPSIMYTRYIWVEFDDTHTVHNYSLALPDPTTVVSVWPATQMNSVRHVSVWPG